MHNPNADRIRKDRREFFSGMEPLSESMLPQWPQEWFPQERIAVLLDRLRPFGVVDFLALRFGPRLAVPADLFHVVVELEGEAIGVDGEGAVVDAGEQFGRKVFDLDAIFFEE